MSAHHDGSRTVSLVEAAQILGVHYMTAYRYVRTGRLAAELDGRVWRVRQDHLDAFRQPRTAAAPRRAAPAARLVERLIAGDEAGCWRIIEDSLAAGASPSSIHLDVLAPALRAVGDGWHEGRVSIADEHRATSTTRRLIARLGPHFARPGRKRGVVVVGAVEGEWHDIPIALVADQIRGAGFSVVELGANTPVDSFVEAARRERPLAVLITVTTTGRDAMVRTTAARLHDEGATVIIGGAAVTAERRARSLGSDEWPGNDGRRVVELLERLHGARSTAVN